MYNKNMKSKVIENKRIKKEKLFNAAFLLLTQRDIHHITIQDIVTEAGVAKGTFYLYFKDKFEIRDALISMEAKRLFEAAIVDFQKQTFTTFEDSVLFVIEHVLDHLDAIRLKFIQKNLSFGVFHKYLQSNFENNQFDSIVLFKQLAQKYQYHFDNPEVTLYLILELTSSSCYESILNNFPLPFQELKPYLLDTIRTILNQGKKRVA